MSILTNSTELDLLDFLNTLVFYLLPHVSYEYNRDQSEQKSILSRLNGLGFAEKIEEKMVEDTITCLKTPLGYETLWSLVFAKDHGESVLNESKRKVFLIAVCGCILRKNKIIYNESVTNFMDEFSQTCPLNREESEEVLNYLFHL